MDQFLFELGIAVSELVTGPHVTFVDPRKHDDTRAMVDHAKRLYKMFKAQGIRPEYIVFSIPATEAGIMAARELSTKYNLNVNLYLVSSLVHAMACAEAGAAAVSIPIGQLLNWNERRRNAAHVDLEFHPGIEAIQTILAYFRLNEIKTKLIGTDFRKFTEMGLLGDFDAVCVSEYQVDRLRWSTVPTSWGEASSSVLLRAGQAQYPTNFLTVEGGFLKLLSPDSRNLIKDILDGGLKELKEEMKKIEAAVVSEVDRQFKVGTMKLKELYPKPKEKKTGTPPSLDKVLETRNVAKDPAREELLAIMECILGTDFRDSDKVF
ncbi:uncharacterized protein LACBIDRAFT_304919 [Laccaria bicolor S238N-H82]|uniref:Predicted protein n=1 Tax=Laccaria bicolor (strain S238N-H82 / ATCC MYA-4686) TaxID=486041 RepID=B0DMM9_LACBS|nr:uncharacterized protein LACBIDRAFT_304919 [Laccaria bicolor S238N-H82]EDR04314.1 predicted protein [Laccaria bicolor S238N-H82]|eukprot:XP_001885205.1 predicted protein [Laccaria bicolor S238N-H82]